MRIYHPVYLPAIAFFIVFISCNWVKEKTKDTVHKTGEVVATAGSEFADGVAKGVEKTFKNQVVVSEQLTKEGLKAGKIIINSTDSTTDNIITAYLVFEKAFEKNVSVKVTDDKGEEYGRVLQNITAREGEGKYIDFILDPRVNIDSKGKIVFE